MLMLQCGCSAVVVVVAVAVAAEGAGLNGLDGVALQCVCVCERDLRALMVVATCTVVECIDMASLIIVVFNNVHFNTVDRIGSGTGLGPW
jgi:hypothetical protein